MSIDTSVIVFVETFVPSVRVVNAHCTLAGVNDFSSVPCESPLDKNRLAEIILTHCFMKRVNYRKTK